MSWLVDTLALYGRVFRRGAELAVRNWVVGLAVILYGEVLGLAAPALAPLGIAGGLLFGILTMACVSSWLTLTGEVIRSGRVSLTDLPQSFIAHLSDLMTVAFILWGLQLIAALVLTPFPLLRIIFGLAVVVFFNAVPELIYLGRHAPAELLVASYRFIGENWIEWFPANVVLVLAMLVTAVLPAGPFNVITTLAGAIVLALAMLVRGLLFLELTTSSRRTREWQRRATG